MLWLVPVRIIMAFGLETHQLFSCFFHGFFSALYPVPEVDLFYL